jgi:hypothetical protein
MYSMPWSYSFFVDLIEIAIGDLSVIILPGAELPAPI